MDLLICNKRTNTCHFLTRNQSQFVTRLYIEIVVDHRNSRVDYALYSVSIRLASTNSKKKTKFGIHPISSQLRKLSNQNSDGKKWCLFVESYL